MDAPTFDSDGYPTEETLQAIREWPPEDSPEQPIRFIKLMKFVQKAWRYANCGYFQVEGDIYHISTVGWSGNESLICALQENLFFWGICWRVHRHGGHYDFEVKE